MTYNFHKIIEKRELITRLGSVDEVVKGLSHLLKRTVKSRWAAIYLLDSEHRNFLPARISGIPRNQLHLFRNMALNPGDIPFLGNMISKKQHLIITGGKRLDFLTPELSKLLQHLTLLVLPMVVRNQVIGAVVVSRSSSYPPFNDKEIAVIRETVAHSALAISHIRLFDESLDMAVEMGRRVDVILTLDEINKAISSSLSPTIIIETAMEHIERIIQCELVVVLEEQNGELGVLAARSRDITIPPSIHQGSILSGPSLAHEVLDTWKSSYLPSLSAIPGLGAVDSSLASAGIQSAMAIPLVSKEAIRGVLLLGDTSIGQFVKEDAFTIEKIAGQLAVALDNARHFQEMRSLFINTVASLANAIDAKSPWTKGHSERVMEISATIARELGLTDELIEKVRLCGLLHDIGKIGIIEALLEKPEQLSEDEFPPMRLHPEKGVAILAPIEQLHDMLPGILYHHERMDGTGYPEGLQGSLIPLEARIIAVADSFDAMVSDRPYKAALTPHQAIRELEREAGTHFDARVVACFCDHLRRKLGPEP
jgi:HD-GYP domain-containing protein (c-di-GMP phosphodiesterase class II)